MLFSETLTFSAKYVLLQNLIYIVDIIDIKKIRYASLIYDLH